MSNVTTIKSLKAVLSSDLMKNKIAEIVGKNAPTFTTSIIQIASQNEMLSRAEPNSIVAAALTAATLNLPLNNSIGQAYIVPFNEKQPDGSKLVKAQFILGYKGLKQLATRSGQFLAMNQKDVRKGEIKFVDHLSGVMEFEWVQDFDERQKLPIVGYVSYFKLINGFESTFYMTREEMTAHGKKFSQTFKYNKGLWVDDYEKMALKTISKLHLNAGEAPLSLEMQMGIKSDQGVLSINEESGELAEDITYVDNTEVKKDPDAERMKMFVNGIETLDDVEFARANVPESEKVLHAEIDMKEQKLKKGIK